MQDTKNTSKMHQAHREWLSLLNFMQDEIKYYQNRLAETASKPQNLNQDEIKKYQKQLLAFIQTIDDLRHKIHINEYYTAYYKEHKLKEGKVLEPSNESIEQEMDKFTADYKTQKDNFQAFFSHKL